MLENKYLDVKWAIFEGGLNFLRRYVREWNQRIGELLGERFTKPAHISL